MKPELPEGSIDGTVELGESGTKASSASGDSTSKKRARSSGKFLLPGPWPDPEDVETRLAASEGVVVPTMVQDILRKPEAPSVTQQATSSHATRETTSSHVTQQTAAPHVEKKIAAPRVAQQTVSSREEKKIAAPRVEKKTAKKVQKAKQPRAKQRAKPSVTRNLAIESVTPDVTRKNRLASSNYWLADHQVIPRPTARAVPRPQRFRPVSRVRSATLLLVSVVGAGLIGIGMVNAGHLTYQFFNTPLAVPTTYPATATATPVPPTATATDTPIAVTPTDISGTVTPEVATATP